MKNCVKADSGKGINISTAVLMILISLVLMLFMACNGDNSGSVDSPDKPDGTTASVESAAATTTTATTTATTTTTTAPTVEFPQLQNLSVGDRFCFGSYEQDNNLENGAEPIEWRVLDVFDDGSALVISEYVLDCLRYNDKFEYVFWETCSLRRWLNDDFFNSAFSDTEQQRVPEVTLCNPDHPLYGIDAGNETKDRVFCLSMDEAIKYFPGADNNVPVEESNGNGLMYWGDNDDRISFATPYAIGNGARTYEEGNCAWWLRTPGRSRRHAALVDQGGDINEDGFHVDLSIHVWWGAVSVRPAIYVTPES